MNKGKTITEIVEASLCTGCGTCAALCPRSAIKMLKDDSKGVYVPQLDSLTPKARCSLLTLAC